MMTCQATPTGRRKITIQMLAARSTRPASYEPTKPGVVLSAFKRAHEAIGCPFKVVALVDYLVGRTRAADWTRGGRIWAWPGNANLQDVLHVERTQLKTLFRVAQELGLLEIHDAPNGQRYGIRDQDGIVVHAFGFDLSPLACRLAEFQQLAAEHVAQWRHGERLRAEITVLRNKVLALTDLGQEQDAAGDWTTIANSTRNIAARRGRSRDPARLSEILMKLDELHSGAIEALTPPEIVETDPKGPESRPPLTPTNPPTIAKANTIMDGPNRSGVNIGTESGAKTRQQLQKSNQRVGTDKRERRQENALRGFVVTPEFVVRIAPSFETWTGKERPSWAELLEASTFVRSELGISKHAWGQACVVLGRIEAVTTLATIAARHQAGEVQSPGGLLRKMVELHQAGTLRLDRTLFGLSDRLKASVH